MANMSNIRIVLFCAIYLATSTNVLAKYYYPQTGQKVNWVTAFQRCAAQGLQLATINSVEEQKDLNHAIAASNVPTGKDEWMWISGTDLGRAGDWTWMSTGKPFTYSNWGEGQPDQAIERCVHVWYSERLGYVWNNNQCEEKLYFICERRQPTHTVIQNQFP